MQKLIYTELCLKNKIILTKEALDYLSCNINKADIAKIPSLVSGKEVINIIKAKEIVFIVNAGGSVIKELYALKDLSPKKYDQKKKYEFLKSMMTQSTTPISMVSPGVQSLIFGIFYYNNLNQPVLEDDQSIICLDFDEFKGDLYLVDNSFVGLLGILTSKKVFIVEDKVLPSITACKCDNKTLSVGKSAFLFFYNFQWDNDNLIALERIIDRQQDVTKLVFLGISTVNETARLFINKKETYEFIFSPSEEFGMINILPKKMLIDASYMNLKVVTNPFYIEMHNFSIGLISDYNFYSKKNGKFYGENHMTNFLELYLSQYSFNHTKGTNLNMGGIPNVIIIGQKVYNFIESVSGVTVVALEEFGNNCGFLRFCEDKLTFHSDDVVDSIKQSNYR